MACSSGQRGKRKCERESEREREGGREGGRDDTSKHRRREGERDREKRKDRERHRERNKHRERDAYAHEREQREGALNVDRQNGVRPCAIAPRQRTTGPFGSSLTHS